MVNRLILALLTVIIALPAQAMRCGNRLVQEGDTKLEVLSKCGEPTFSEGSGIIEQEDEIATADRLNEKLLLIGRRQTRFSQPVETWHYNCGANRFARVLTFVGPYLQRIETTDHGVGNSGCKQKPAASNQQPADPVNNHPTTSTRQPRGVLDAAIEFRDLHQRNLDAAATTNEQLVSDEVVHKWQDDQGQWHYSASPQP